MRTLLLFFELLASCICCLLYSNIPVGVATFMRYMQVMGETAFVMAY